MMVLEEKLWFIIAYSALITGLGISVKTKPKNKEMLSKDSFAASMSWLMGSSSMSQGSKIAANSMMQWTTDSASLRFW